MPDPERRIVEYDRLNWLGKAVFVGGQLARVLGLLVEAAVDRTAGILGEAERAFRDALGDEVEDAKVLDEDPPEGRPPAGQDRRQGVVS